MREEVIFHPMASMAGEFLDPEFRNYLAGPAIVRERGNGEMADLEVKAFEMFAAGEKTNAVARKLFNNWGRTKKLRERWDAEQGGESAAPAAAADVDQDEEEPQPFELKLDLPRVGLAGVFATFAPDERAYGVQAILQLRINEAAAKA